MALYIKAPDGRIVACPRAQTTTTIVDGVPVTAVNPKALKPGWAVAGKSAPTGETEPLPIPAPATSPLTTPIIAAVNAARPAALAAARKGG